ncbi:MAG TPA: acyl-CoA dehydrogenase family protein [Actinomycetota bacterium]|nr:acyl-CoA dehydrogenase family protein [Actinomycetota bacterium]
MDFELSTDQRQVRDLVREFATQEIAPGAGERDEREEFPLDIVKKLGELGICGVPLPDDVGGLGADAVTWALVIEELGRADPSVAVTVSVASGLAGGMIDRYGTPEQRQRWLPPIASGEMLAGFGLTEPGSGSDAAALRTRARAVDGEWVIDGSKSFITNSGTPITGFVVVACRTGEGDDDAVSTILVPADAPGFVVGAPYRKLGWRSSDTHELSFEGCRVPEEHLLGEPGKGLAQCLSALDDGRISIAALSVGLAQGCLDASASYAKDREAFGRPIGAYEAIAFKLADMRAAIEGARLLTYRAAWLKDRGQPYTTDAAIAKLRASEIAVDVARDAIQVHGGYGYTEEFPVARAYRDAKVLEIGEGTSEILRLVIARDLGLQPQV